MQANSLRARLEAEAAGAPLQRRGNLFSDEQLASSRPFATACGELLYASIGSPHGERIGAPAELLPLIV